jgi:ribosome-associated protein
MSQRTIEFTIQEEYIELFKLIKVVRIAGSGGEAKSLISEGLVLLNGQVELRKRAKVVKGDRVEYEDFLIMIK